MFGSCRGEGKLGCLVVILLITLSVFLVYKIGPVYFDKISFEDDFARIVNRAGAENWRDQAIRDQVINAARAGHFEVNPKDIKVDRVGRFQSASRLKVTVKIRRQVEFPGYVKMFEFQPEATALIGRL